MEGRATRAIIDLDALESNIRILKANLSHGTGLMAVVKANGYGHGAVMVARTAVQAGATWLAVATVDEGAMLRQAGVAVPILVLGPIDPSEAQAAASARLTIAIGGPDLLDPLRQAAEACQHGPLSVHLKIDTGMRRYGALPSEALALARAIVNIPALHLTGVFTHFARADEADETPTRLQAERFDQTVAELRRAGIAVGLLHAANSAAALRSRAYDYHLVRAGIAIYGIPPSRDVVLWPGMRPVMTLCSRIRRVVRLLPGEGVSYGATYRARENECLGLVPIGYGDGYHRLLSNRAWMGISGRRAPVAGRICMDQTLVRLPEGSEISPGDEVVVFGAGENGEPTLPELAELAETIPYELATAVSPRVPRWFIREGRIVAVENLSGLYEMT
ncbi:MAG: alanine racemase [Thermomicrobiales bacterium]|nr:MAG: alanine racemase [Thermomicrobiales bacterium]